MKDLVGRRGAAKDPSLPLFGAAGFLYKGCKRAVTVLPLVWCILSFQFHTMVFLDGRFRIKKWYSRQVRSLMIWQILDDIGMLRRGDMGCW